MNELSKKRIECCRVCKSSRETILIGLTCGRFMFPTKNTCGCIVALKVLIESEHCPQKKW